MTIICTRNAQKKAATMVNSNDKDGNEIGALTSEVNHDEDGIQYEKSTTARVTEPTSRSAMSHLSKRKSHKMIHGGWKRNKSNVQLLDSISNKTTMANQQQKKNTSLKDSFVSIIQNKYANYPLVRDMIINEKVRYV